MDGIKHEKRIYIETYGCQMNRLDSELLAGIFEGVGYCTATEKEQADVVLVNTCGVREHAEQRVLGRIAELGQLKRARPDLVLGVVGCMAQRLGERLFEMRPEVDVVAGPDSYRALPALIEERSDHRRYRLLSLQSDEQYEGIHPHREGKVRAWVAIMRGCNNFCSYCVVPYTRGRERSRGHRFIIHEIEDLVREGVRDVTLLGQNVNSYRDGVADASEDVGFAELLRRIIRETGIPRLRFLTSHPKDMSEDALSVMGESKSLCEHLHLPLQSGSDDVLNRMNRRYTVDQYLRIVDRAHERIPGLSLTTDVVVGFPGETERDFEQTMDVMRGVRFDDAYTYRYSPREGTKAFEMVDDVPDEEKARRLTELIALQRTISRERNEALIGSEVEILVEGPSRDRQGMLGRTRTDKPVIVHERGWTEGDWTHVKIVETTGATLIGTVERET